jgi:hypothetical protein
MGLSVEIKRRSRPPGSLSTVAALSLEWESQRMQIGIDLRAPQQDAEAAQQQIRKERGLRQGRSQSEPEATNGERRRIIIG